MPGQITLTPITETCRAITADLGARARPLAETTGNAFPMNY